MGFITNIRATVPTTGSYGADGLPNGVKNNFGDVRAGGTIADTAQWSGYLMGEGNPITTINSGIGPVEGAVPGIFNSGAQVINAIQTTIAGTANTTLQGAQSDTANVAQTPLQLGALRTYYYKTAVVAGNWNVFNGTFSSISNAASGAWNITEEVDNSETLIGSGTDIAANPTQDSPGRITYRDGSPNPIQSGYQPRYNW